jgi:hypothetical protein
MKPPAVYPGRLEAESEALVFAWERPPRRALRLAGLMAASLFVHALGFYVLQVAYTSTATLSPPPAQVTLLPPDAPGNPSALTRWLTIYDPALMAQLPTPTSEQALETLRFHYVPSYASALPAFKPLGKPAASGAPPRPPLFDSTPLPPLPTFAAEGSLARGASSHVPSRLSLTGTISALAPKPLPPIRFTTAGGSAAQGVKPLEPTVYLVGVPAGGGMPFLFRQASFGNAAADESAREADEYARDYLSRLSFQPAPDPASAPWGWATFYWGAEVYR